MFTNDIEVVVIFFRSNLPSPVLGRLIRGSAYTRVYTVCAELFSNYSLALYFCGKIIKSCSLNVGEIDYRGQFRQHLT